jgi:hypothetical protein
MFKTYIFLMNAKRSSRSYFSIDALKASQMVVVVVVGVAGGAAIADPWRP